MNSIHIIYPYKNGSCWVFDDPNVGLRAEPFVYGMSEILDCLTESIPDAVGGIEIVFSGRPFPGYTDRLDWLREEYGGNHYRHDALDMVGWLCPALFKYFERAPAHIYLKVCRALGEH